MKYRANRKGFTLIELMIVIAIVAILVALALPSYTSYVRKAKRGDAQSLLMNWANMQEIWRANNTTYADATDITVPTLDLYTFTITDVSATTYALAADATGDQADDKDRNQPCNPLILDQSGRKWPQDTDWPAVGTVTYCWGN